MDHVIARTEEDLEVQRLLNEEPEQLEVKCNPQDVYSRRQALFSPLDFSPTSQFPTIYGNPAAQEARPQYQTPSTSSQLPSWAQPPPMIRSTAANQLPPPTSTWTPAAAARAAAEAAMRESRENVPDSTGACAGLHVQHIHPHMLETAQHIYRGLAEVSLSRSSEALGVTQGTLNPYLGRLSPVSELRDRGKPTLIRTQYIKRHLSRTLAQCYIGVHNVLRRTCYNAGVIAPLDRRAQQPFLPPVHKDHPMFTSRKTPRLRIRLFNVQVHDDIWRARAAVAALFVQQPEEVLLEKPVMLEKGPALDMLVEVPVEWTEHLETGSLGTCFNHEEWQAQVAGYEAACLEAERVRVLAVDALPEGLREFQQWQQTPHLLDYDKLRAQQDEIVFTQLLEEGGSRPTAFYNNREQKITYSSPTL